MCRVSHLELAQFSHSLKSQLRSWDCQSGNRLNITRLFGRRTGIFRGGFLLGLTTSKRSTNENARSSVCSQLGAEVSDQSCDFLFAAIQSSRLINSAISN